MKKRFDELSEEKVQVDRDYNELKAKNEDLLSRQKKMVDKAFSLIMMEVWSVDLELEVPRVEKYINKAIILKAIEDWKKSSPA